MAAQTAKERIQSAHGGADRDERIPRPMAAQTATKGFTGPWRRRPRRKDSPERYSTRGVAPGRFSRRRPTVERGGLRNR
jgi:hypothetical protein